MTRGKAKMEIRFHKTQSKVLRYLQKKRYVVLVAGRRYGKTHVAIVALILMAVNVPSARVWYIEPTYRQAKDNAWDILKHCLPHEWVLKTNETDLQITLKNNSKIALKGSDNPDSLRGPGLNLLVIDEASDIKDLKNLWQAVVGPALTTTRGKAFFIGSPRGYDYFHELYLKAISRDGPDADDWAGFLYTTREGGYVSDEELESRRLEIDSRIYRQEYEASFETLSGRVYYQFDRNYNVAEVEDVGGEILVGMDFNVNPMSAVIAVRAGSRCYVIDEIIIPNSNTQEMADEVYRRYGDLPADDPNYEILKKLGQESAIPKRTIRVYPDPSGSSRKTSAPLGQTDLTILRNRGFEVIAPRRAPNVVDRLNTVNAMLCNAAGKRNTLIHPRCKTLAGCLEGLTYKEGKNQPDKSLNLDHLPDALGYLLWSEFPVLRGSVRSGELLL